MAEIELFLSLRFSGAHSGHGSWLPDSSEPEIQIYS